MTSPVSARPAGEDDEPIHKLAPMQFSSGYSLDLYCDHANPAHGFNDFPHTFAGETFRECAAEARGRGWKIRVKTRTATCPKCRNQEDAGRG